MWNVSGGTSFKGSGKAQRAIRGQTEVTNVAQPSQIWALTLLTLQRVGRRQNHPFGESRIQTAEIRHLGRVLQVVAKEMHLLVILGGLPE